MPISCLLAGCLTFLTAADPAPVRIVIEEDRSPAPLAKTADAGALRPEPSQRFQHEEVLGKLKVQASLREAVRLLGEAKYQEAIDKLEPGLHEASGSAHYLSSLETAYRGRITELLKAGNPDAAKVFAERLRVLSPMEQSAVQAASAVVEAAADAVVKQALVEPTKAEQPAVAPVRGADFQARGKLDQSAGESPFRQAEALFEQKQYAQALPLYEKAYELDPVAVQAGRERWGYCLLYVSVDRYNQLVDKNHSAVDLKAWTDLEGDVRLARRLAPTMEYCDSVLAEINKQIEARRRPAADDKAKSVASTAAPASAGRAAVGRYNQSPLKNVPERSFRHLPGRSQSWSVVETKNFRIYHRNPALAEEVAQLAEEARVHGHEMWFANEPMEQWTPACEIYLYPTAHEYSQSTGVAAQSPGHTKVVPDNGRIVSRTVCLRVDDPNMKHAVLPHEITHVVLAGRFGSHSLPRWADEGMAVLTEPRNKQDSHLANLSQSRRSRRGFGCAQLLTMGDYPGGGQMLDFYAHSVGVCRLLVEKGGTEKLVQFLRQSLQSGNYEVALRQVYNIDFASLEAEFNQFVAGLNSNGVQTASR